MFLIGGLLPVVAFALVEEIYGTMGGLIAAMVFGAGEMIWEYWKTGRIQAITIGANVMVIGLGAVSLYEGSALWFKLQPAVFTFAFALVLLVTSLLKKPLLVTLARKQTPDLPELGVRRLSGMNFRSGLLFLAITALSVHAALYWSTPAWAMLKGFGVPVIFFAYIALEFLVIRFFR